MNIIAPINVAALRVSPSTTQTAKSALYDFSALGLHPLSSGGNLIAARRFHDAGEFLNREPGIHLHWSLPKAYVQGEQNGEDGRLEFSALPNRWLVTRIYRNADGRTNLTMWILEADAHASTQSTVNGSPTTLPWMDSAGSLYGLEFHYAGWRTVLTSTWTEPAGSPLDGIAYLGKSLQAPVAYGETFTAYYRHCRNLFAIYDDLSDLFPDSNQLELECSFSVSYSVIGWVSPQSSDAAFAVLNRASAAYARMPAGNRPAFSDFIQQTCEKELKWSLDDYAGFTPANTGHTQGVLCGLISGIQWNIQSPGSPEYPSALPEAGGISSSIGNNAAEALSAYLSSVEKPPSASDPGGNGPGSVTASLEWLLNALQYGQLNELGGGEAGVGQLDEYLHARSFGSQVGGCVWSVRQTATPGSKATHRESVEVTLPLPLALLLGRLNDAQQQYGTLCDEIAGRRQKLFFDWCYHMNTIESNVVHGNSPLSQDVSKDFLLDGLIHLFPRLARAGATGEIANMSGPYTYSPAPFRIAAPASMYPELSGYIFNRRPNAKAGDLVTGLLKLHQTWAVAISGNLQGLRAALQTASPAIERAMQGGATASSYVGQAVAAVQKAQTLAQSLTADFQSGVLPEGLAAIKAAVDANAAALDALTDPVSGIFARYLPVGSGDSVPLPPGKVYTGTMKSFEAFSNAASWGPLGPFRGIGDLLNRLTGHGAFEPPILNTELAALYVASAYFWRLSGETATHTVPYYLQLALQETNSAQLDAQNASKALSQAVAALTSAGTVAEIGQSLTAIEATSLPRLLATLNAGTPDLMSALTQVEELITDQTAGVTPRPILALIAAIEGPDYRSFVDAIDTAGQIVRSRLPLAQQVSLLSTFLNSQIERDYELGGTPAPAFWQPGEPVLLLAETAGKSNLIKPVARNGRAALLPCRLDNEVVGTTAAVAWPAQAASLSSSLNPAIPGLSTVLQSLVQEAYLMSPEMETITSPKTLRDAAIQNQQLHFDKFNHIELVAPPAPLNGRLPYFIAWSWSQGRDTFLPLFVFWQVEYVYSQQVSFGGGSLPESYLGAYSLDPYLVDYQPTSGSISNFRKNLETPNYFSFYGVSTLSSASTANLCDQIGKYSVNTFDYDPSKGLPAPSDPNYPELQLFYEAYTKFRTLNVLSQGLGGSNAGLLQRSQGLQLPLNIPRLWVDSGGKNLPQADFWPAQFLLNQSAGWPADWVSEAINFDAFTPGVDAVYFSPLRAGFAQLKEITLVDVFGRFVDLPGPNPRAISGSLQSTTPSPLPDHQIYLPPRIVQPARVSARWISAASPDGMSCFTEWNPHPAASPICGWLTPDHLDGSLMIYNGDGALLGSLRPVEQQLRWFTVPGEAYPPGIDNRSLMLSDLASRNANPALQSFLKTFAYGAQTGASARNFELFLQVIDQARQFIITKSMQEDQALSILVGQPLVLARASIQLQLKGLPYVSLDSRTYIPWNGAGAQFELDESGFVPYNFGNFNNGGIPDLQVPLRIGVIDYQKNGQTIPYFDDGLIGFFLNDDYGAFYTPVDVASAYQIQSTRGSTMAGPTFTYSGGAITVTMLLDPRASVHITSGLLPVETMRIPPEQLVAALNRIETCFLTAPILQDAAGFSLPLPGEPGHGWSWWQAGQPADIPVTSSQASADAHFSSTSQTIADGWLKLRKI